MGPLSWIEWQPFLDERQTTYVARKQEGGRDMTYRRDQVLLILEKDEAVLRRMGVRRIGLFGSTVHGKARKDSDLDFVVELDRVSFDGYMDLKFHLEDRFHKRVDLVLPHTLKSAIRRTILEEVVYAPGF